LKKTPTLKKKKTTDSGKNGGKREKATTKERSRPSSYENISPKKAPSKTRWGTSIAGWRRPSREAYRDSQRKKNSGAKDGQRKGETELGDPKK